MNESASTENQRFSFPRFWQLMKSDLRINRPKYLRIAATIAGCFLTIAILLSIFAYNNITNPRNFYIGDYVAYYNMACSLIISLGLTILGSLTFVSMNSKSGRISTLMMPASMLEKFLLRFLIYFVAGTILLIVGYYVGVIEMILALSPKVDGFGFSSYGFDSSSFGEIIATLSLPAIFGNALYALGSSIWPKSAWVKTWVVTQIVWVAVMFFTAFGLFDLFAEIFYWLKTIDNFDSDIYRLKCIYYILFTILIIACWGLAWWRFRTTQIVQRFMKR